jgi:hypothetical protein
MVLFAQPEHYIHAPSSSTLLAQSSTLYDLLAIGEKRGALP